jgi:hypothetical protein
MPRIKRGDYGRCGLTNPMPPIAESSMQRVLPCLIAIVPIALIPISGCGPSRESGPPKIESGSKITRPNYDRIKEKMLRAEVEAVLGKGIDTPPPKGDDLPIGFFSKEGHVTITYVEWRDAGKKIRIAFFNDKVALREQEGLE